MAETERHDSYLATRNGRWYFQRRLRGRLVRVSLRTTDRETARATVNVLYAYTSELARLGMQHAEVFRLSKVRAQQLYEQRLTASTWSHPALPPTAAPTVIPQEHLHTHTSTPQQQAPAALTLTPVSHPLLISEALEDALRDLCRSGGTEHHRKYREAFTEFAELNPDAHFHDIRFADASAHLDNLLRLPRRRTDLKPYGEKVTIAGLEESSSWRAAYLELHLPTITINSATMIRVTSIL